MDTKSRTKNPLKSRKKNFKKSNKQKLKKANQWTNRFVVECEGIRLCDVGPSVCVAIAQERRKAGQKDVSYYADRPGTFNKSIFMHFFIILSTNMNKMTRFSEQRLKLILRTNQTRAQQD
jgi:hypothetical protein